ncbi:PREDICTED: uncharacterized protein LOC108756734 [Trachymyrmex septentrionalis]|uniref:uncharacterized protein LOC108756734 n=1 Tax=Trachymyrmex septentrionalis TaxID=34720 RepID=UPI00084EF6B1|nr:PREDICTED: uncharacterized protein LOC108756734 [Trachymyrmex septentrionalis]XP_018356260.1 PREDICTED: uncharacterized protein LOC108756734 [Trachymyrmex septentrionalis]
MFEVSSGRGFWAKKYIISAYKKIIHGGIISGLFHEDGISEIAGIPFRELSHSFATSAANVFNGFREHIDNFRTRLAQRINIPPEYPTLHRLVHGDIWPNVARPAPIVPGRLIISPRPIGGNNRAIDDSIASGRLIAPRPIGNYRGIGDSIDSGAASAGAASSAASRRLAKYSST